MLSKVYIETTIPSFYYNTRKAPEHVARMNWTRLWWKTCRPLYDVCSSLAVLDELNRREHPLKLQKMALLKDVTLLKITPEVIKVVEVYIARKVMPTDPVGDALHLALASHHKCDILLSWNCNHIANVQKYDHVRKVNTQLGLHVPLLVTPLEFLTDQK
ncbi:MAG: type II toxin-antitoxin system VapC family toxin [Verrucomicrobiae bacterium]|nr:type II toxin-antitoxin system VapC family toxin [Verrucomicrobiae bacterium]